MNHDNLAQRFITRWQACGGTRAEHWWQQIEQHYGEPQRAYHNLGHVSHCLNQLDAAGDRVEEHQATELAIWFHDIIYRYSARDNEELSAAAFREAAGDAIDPALVERVSDFILATRHIGDAADPGCAYIVDIDLSGFGLPWEGYLADSNALRQEATDVDDVRYFQGKQRFLDGLIARSRIFQTEYFFAQLEQQARDNIARYMAQFQQQVLAR